jgi:hypothetical protein
MTNSLECALPCVARAVTFFSDPKLTTRACSKSDVSAVQAELLHRNAFWASRYKKNIEI